MSPSSPNPHPHHPVDNTDKLVKLRRHPFAEPRFLEDAKQQWCAIFCAIGLGILLMTTFGALKNPEPFLQFNLAIGGLFIMGASASSIMNSYKCTSSSAEEIVHSDQTVNETIEEKYVDMPANRPRDFDSPEVQ